MENYHFLLKTASSTCTGNIPVNYQGNTPSTPAIPWQFEHWHCITDYTNATTTTNASSTVPYGDWLIMNSLILFAVAFIPVGTLFSLLRKNR